MSNTKTLKGRVINKHKTEAAWLLDVYPDGDITLEPRVDAFIPLDGELIIYDPDSVYTERRIKIGDGATNVAALPFYQENLATVDKIGTLDAWYGEVSQLDARTSGITWYDGCAFLGGDDEELCVTSISQRVPIVAGNNVTLEVDAENQVVKINATGGSSSNASLIGTWTVIDEPEIPTTNLPLSFMSNGKTYTQISWGYTGPTQWGIYNLQYQTEDHIYSDTAYTNNPSGSYGITHGWDNEAYKTITITEEPTDANAIAWLGNNTDAPKVIVYQEKVDSSLATTNKTIVGAINEVYVGLGDISTALDSIISQTESIIGGNS